MKKSGMWMIVSVVVALCMLMSVSGCAATAPTTTAPATTAPTGGTPQYGGVLKILANNEPTFAGWTPLTTGWFNGLWSCITIERLLAMNDKAMPGPWLAESWKIAPDNKSITLSLKKGVKFHDGTDFNAQAVKYDLDLYRTQPTTELAVVQSIDAVDDYTVRLNLSKWDSTLLNSFCLTPGMMMSPAALAKGKDWAAINPVGTGPFKFVSWDKTVSMKFTKFDGYWQKGKPYLDGIELIFVTDPMTASASFQRGEGLAWQTQYQKETADLEKTGKYNVSRMYTACNMLLPDSAHPNSPFADIRVRQAVNYALDLKAIAPVAGPYCTPAQQFAVSESSPAWNPNIVGYSYNPQKAKELLAAAGYADGFKTKIIAPAGEVSQWITPALGYLKAVGIDASLDSQTPAKLTEVRVAGWEGLFFGYVNLSASDWIALGQWLCQ